MTLQDFGLVKDQIIYDLGGRPLRVGRMSHWECVVLYPETAESKPRQTYLVPTVCGQSTEFLSISCSAGWGFSVDRLRALLQKQPSEPYTAYTGILIGALK
jgi:hypothetical protein